MVSKFASNMYQQMKARMMGDDLFTIQLLSLFDPLWGNELPKWAYAPTTAHSERQALARKFEAAIQKIYKQVLHSESPGTHNAATRGAGHLQPESQEGTNSPPTPAIDWVPLAPAVASQDSDKEPRVGTKRSRELQERLEAALWAPALGVRQEG